jgi:hypothetical protein
MIRSPWWVGILHPVNLFVLGAAVVAGLIAAWWLFPVGLLIWGLMVFNVARDPALRLSHEMQSRAPIAQRFQRSFERLERSQVRLFNALNATPLRTRQQLQPVMDEIKALVDVAHHLCERMTALENYRLVSQSQNWQAELQQMQYALEHTPDAQVRQQYAESYRALQERQARLQAICNQLDRLEAHLVNLASEMDMIMAEVLRLQALKPDDAAQFIVPLQAAIRQRLEETENFGREVALEP